MTNLPLEEMVRLNRERTPGPWHDYEHGIWDEAEGSMTYGVPLLRAAHDGDRSWGRRLPGGEREANAAFIAFMANHADSLIEAAQNSAKQAERLAGAEEERDSATDALARIKQWCEAYPLDIFPEPDLKRAAEVLRAAGMTLGSISASNMRHVLSGVAKIASEGPPSPSLQAENAEQPG